jgi:hypothetical protein
MTLTSRELKRINYGLNHEIELLMQKNKQLETAGRSMLRATIISSVSLAALAFRGLPSFAENRPKTQVAMVLIPAAMIAAPFIVSPHKVDRGVQRVEQMIGKSIQKVGSFIYHHPGKTIGLAAAIFVGYSGHTYFNRESNDTPSEAQTPDTVRSMADPLEDENTVQPQELSAEEVEDENTVQPQELSAEEVEDENTVRPQELSAEEESPALKAEEPPSEKQPSLADFLRNCPFSL